MAGASSCKTRHDVEQNETLVGRENLVLICFITVFQMKDLGM